MPQGNVEEARRARLNPQQPWRRRIVFHALRNRLRALADRARPPHLRDARRGEDLAYDYLRRSGYTVVARNYRPRVGKAELDLVAWDGDRLAVVEVKTRAGVEFGRPAEAVGREKRQMLVRGATEYARRANVDFDRLRFDIVSVVLEDPPRIELEKDAFSARSARAASRGVGRF